MWRAFFLAVGITLCIVGAECLVFDRAILSSGSEKIAGNADRPSLVDGSYAAVERREFVPKEWMPWSMLATGSVVILYSFTIPRRVAS